VSAQILGISNRHSWHANQSEAASGQRLIPTEGGERPDSGIQDAGIYPRVCADKLSPLTAAAERNERTRQSSTASQLISTLTLTLKCRWIGRLQHAAGGRVTFPAVDPHQRVARTFQSFAFFAIFAGDSRPPTCNHAGNSVRRYGMPRDPAALRNDSGSEKYMPTYEMRLLQLHTQPRRRFCEKSALIL